MPLLLKLLIFIYKCQITKKKKEKKSHSKQANKIIFQFKMLLVLYNSQAFFFNVQQSTTPLKTKSQCKSRWQAQKTSFSCEQEQKGRKLQIPFHFVRILNKQNARERTWKLLRNPTRTVSQLTEAFHRTNGRGSEYTWMPPLYNVITR